jgi:hypothetical protein
MQDPFEILRTITTVKTAGEILTSMADKLMVVGQGGVDDEGRKFVTVFTNARGRGFGCDKCYVEGPAYDGYIAFLRALPADLEAYNPDCDWDVLFKCEELWPCPITRHLAALAGLQRQSVTGRMVMHLNDGNFDLDDECSHALKK